MKFAHASLPRFLCGLALVLPAAAYASDVDGGSQFGRLDLGPAPLGGTLSAVLRAPAANKPALVLLDTALSPADPDGFGPLPFLQLLAPATTLTLLPSVGPGVVAIQASVPNDPALFGLTIYAQAILITGSDRFEATAVTATTIGPLPIAPSFQDASANLPAISSTVATHTGAARDVDFDGDFDLVIATSAGVRLYRNDGALAFTDVTATAFPPEAALDAFFVELFDADGDRDLDVFVGGGLSSPNDPPLQNFLLLNQFAQGGGLAFVAAPLPAVNGLPQDVAIVDLDRDGDLDLVIASGQDGVHSSEQADPVTLLVNLGGGAFAVDAAFLAAPWNAVGAFNNGVASGDIDNDGDVDLLIARSDTGAFDGVPGQPNVLLRNDGGLVFSDVSATQLQPAFSDNSRKARFADVDGDGDLDLLVANSVASVTADISGEMYFNDGSGNFVEAPGFFPQIFETELTIGLDMHLIDADLDGDLDVLFALHEFFDFDGSLGSPGGTGGDDLLLINQGGFQAGFPGHFLIDPTFTTGDAFVSPDHVVADFDLDGDEDVFVCAEGGLLMPKLQDRLLENLRIP
jgi:hypothetical protein